MLCYTYIKVVGNMSKKKLIILIVVAVIGVIGLALGSSYALFTFNLTKNSNFKTVVGNLELSISDTTNEDRIIINNLEPKKDSVALTEDGYTFTLTNTGNVDVFYTVYLDDIIPVGETKERIGNNLMKANLSESIKISPLNTTMVSELDNNRIGTGVLRAGDNITYTLRLWVDYNADNTVQGKYYASKIRISSTQEKSVVYDSVEKVLAQFKPSELGEAILCSYSDGIYYDCSAYETLQKAMVTKNDGYIIVADNIKSSRTISVDSNKDFTIDLNGKKIEFASLNSSFINYGKVDLFDSDGNGKIYSDNSTMVINNVGTLNLKNIVIAADRTAIRNAPNSTIKIGGKVVVIGSYAINNEGRFDIVQENDPIYIKSFRTNAINHTNGIMNLNGTKANKCTDNPDDTTSGLCIYSKSSYIIHSFSDMNINGATVAGSEKALYDAGGVFTICNSYASGDVSVRFGATFNYNNFMVPTGKKIYHETDTTIENLATCPITSE